MNFAVTLWEVPGGTVMDCVFTTPVLGRPRLNRPWSCSGLIYWLLARILHSLPWLGPKFLKLLSVSGSLCRLCCCCCFPKDFSVILPTPNFSDVTHRGCPCYWVDQRGLENQWPLIPPRRSGVYFSSSNSDLASWCLLQLTKCSRKDAVPFWSLDFKRSGSICLLLAMKLPGKEV